MTTVLMLMIDNDGFYLDTGEETVKHGSQLAFTGSYTEFYHTTISRGSQLYQYDTCSGMHMTEKHRHMHRHSGTDRQTVTHTCTCMHTHSCTHTHTCSDAHIYTVAHTQTHTHMYV